MNQFDGNCFNSNRYEPDLQQFSSLAANISLLCSFRAKLGQLRVRCRFLKRPGDVQHVLPPIHHFLISSNLYE